MVFTFAGGTTMIFLKLYKLILGFVDFYLFQKNKIKIETVEPTTPRG